MAKYDPKYINKEEKNLMEGIDRMEVRKLRTPSKKTQRQFRVAAKRYLKKEAKMNIRIDLYELDRIKEKAEKQGLKYQTFIKSILHKYITGQLVEKDSRVE